MVNAVLTTVVAALAGLRLCAAQSEYTNETDPYCGQSRPVYPTPVGNGTTNDAWALAYQRAKALTTQMTVEELANFTHGWTGLCTGNTGSIPRLGIEPLCLQDGPDGVRAQEFVSAFPAGIHLGAAFDRNLSYQYGEALGAEYRGKGINVGLGPVGGPLGRIARGGRNWEGTSNDPYLASISVGGITKGMQDAGTIACPKHWILNEQEYRRNPETGLGEAVSSNVDDRTLHELYVFPFMDAIREGAASVMCSYQRSNNSYGCQNSRLINGVLKGELGFEGFLVSDWGAQHSGVASANAGLDLVMPSEGFWGASLVEAVNNGSVTHKRIEDMATRILAAWYYTGQDGADYPAVGVYSNLQKHAPVDVQNGHKALIREIGAAGTVLVKNVNGTLPLKSPKFLTVYGYDAALPPSPWASTSYGPGFGTDEINTYNGTIIAGGGSGITTPPYVTSPFQAIQDRVIADGGIVKWDFYSENPSPAYVNTEACFVFINAWASEGYDRPSLKDDIAPRYEFGFGLSYTTFAYSALASAPVGSPVAGLPDAGVAIVQGGHPQLWEEVYSVTAQVQNTGDVAGHEVAQLYVGIPVDGTPIRQLRGFERVYLEAGASATVEFKLVRRDLSFWDVVAQQWRLPEGEFDVWVGASSRDLRLSGTFTV